MPHFGCFPRHRKMTHMQVSLQQTRSIMSDERGQSERQLWAPPGSGIEGPDLGGGGLFGGGGRLGGPAPPAYKNNLNHFTDVVSHLSFPEADLGWQCWCWGVIVTRARS